MNIVSFLTVVGIVIFSLQSEKSHGQETDTLNGGRSWITIGSDAAKNIQSNFSHQIPLTQYNFVTTMTQEVSIVQVQNNKLNVLSEFMHEQYKRCGGYIYHASLEEAISYVENLQNVQPLVVNYTIDNSTGVSDLLAELNQNNLTSTVNTLSAYNNRYYTQQSGVNAAIWIRDEWQNIASGRSDISVELYSHSWQQPSVIATVTGTSNPDEIVVIGGHLDSINQSNPSNGRAPGADDNASGIAVATETLRAIVASGYRPARTIKFMGYAAEEVGLRGSNAIAQEFKNTNQNVIGVAQFDMTGYQGTSNRDIVFMTDYTNAAQNEFMTQLLDTYFQDIIYGFSQCGYGCSDHASWHNQGFPASIPFESNINDYNPTIHTSNDVSFDSSHAIKFAKLSVAYVAELAKGGTGPTPTITPTPTPTATPTPTPPPSDNVLVNGVPKTGLSATQGDDIVFVMDVPAGASNISFTISGGSGDADLYVSFGSTPTDSTYDCRPYRNGNSESCSGSQNNGRYYVRVKAYRTFSGLSLTGSFDESQPPGDIEPININYSDISVGRREWQRYTQDIAEGYANLSISISGGSGDSDIYVRRGSEPSTSAYDCRPYRNGNNETCSFDLPQAGIWHIGIYGYRASSGVTLNISATP